MPDDAPQDVSQEVPRNTPPDAARALARNAPACNNWTQTRSDLAPAPTLLDAGIHSTADFFTPRLIVGWARGLM